MFLINYQYVWSYAIFLFKFWHTINRSSYLEVFCKKGVLGNFSKFTGKQLCQCLFFNKGAGLRPATLLKKRLWHRCFPVNFEKLLRTPFLTEHLRWLLLYKNDLKHAVTMPSHQGYCLTYIYGCIMF